MWFILPLVVVVAACLSSLFVGWFEEERPEFLRQNIFTRCLVILASLPAVLSIIVVYTVILPIALLYEIAEEGQVTGDVWSTYVEFLGDTWHLFTNYMPAFVLSDDWRGPWSSL